MKKRKKRRNGKNGVGKTGGLMWASGPLTFTIQEISISAGYEKIHSCCVKVQNMIDHES